MRREDLLEALKLILLGTGKGIIYESVGVFDGSWLRSFRENFSVSCKLETGADGGVPAAPLYEALSRMSGEDVEITSDEIKIQFKAGSTRLILLKKAETQLSELKANLTSLDLDNVTWKPVPANFIEGLMLSLFSADPGPRGKLCGVVIKGSIILAIDNYRVSRYDLGQEIFDDVVRLEVTAVNKLIRIKKDFELAAMTAGWLHLKTTEENLVVSLRRLPISDYPLDEVIDAFDDAGFDKDSVSYELPAGLEKSIDRVEILAPIGERELNFATQIEIRTEDGHLVVKGENVIGQVKDRIPCTCQIPGGIKLAPSFIKKLLSITRTFKVNQSKTRAMFETPNFKYLMIAKMD